ncbi:DUF3265 domain-containing protein [Vibrio splendidus]|nr:DUF3265 domain-containing protein [Vibrio splendidus]
MRNAWHFYHALHSVFNAVYGSIGIELPTP